MEGQEGRGGKGREGRKEGAGEKEGMERNGREGEGYPPPNENPGYDSVENHCVLGVSIFASRCYA